MSTGGFSRQGVLSLAIKEKSQLYGAYMPGLKGGGLVVPTPKRYNLGDEVFVMLTLLDDKERLPVAGRVVWITPAGAQGNRPPGIGVQLNESTDGEMVRGKIETHLAGMISGDKPTFTM